MTIRVRTDRLLLGFHGFALLRGWPHGDASEADERMVAMRELLSRSDDLVEVLDVDALDLSAAYEEWAETYDTIANGLIATEEPVVRSLLAEIPPGRALDAAAGTGRYAAILSELGHDVVAVDASAGMLGRMPSKGFRALGALGDLHRLPIRDGSMDLAVCGLALTHVSDLTPAIAELARVVRPGGRVMLSDVHPVAVSMGAQAMFRRSDGSRAFAYNHIHWPSAYVEALTSAGLEIEHAAEPLVDRAFVDDLPDPDVRAGAQASLMGMPLALIWLARKRT